jgi:hypothetical protein
MKMQYFIGLIEADTDKLNAFSGPVIVKQMTTLKETISKYGECNFYTVTDINAFERFKAELKRLNKL